MIICEEGKTCCWSLWQAGVSTQMSRGHTEACVEVNGSWIKMRFNPCVEVASRFYLRNCNADKEEWRWKLTENIHSDRCQHSWETCRWSQAAVQPSSDHIPAPPHVPMRGILYKPVANCLRPGPRWAWPSASGATQTRRNTPNIHTTGMAKRWLM